MKIKSKVNAGPLQGSDSWELAQLVGLIIDHRWIIVAITALFMLAGTLYITFATPIYSADALVQIEQKGAENILNDLSQMLPGSTPQSATEIEIIKSRLVIGKTVDDLGLDSLVEQKYFPVVGRGFARLMGNKPAEITVTRFNLPLSWDDRNVELMVDNANAYSVRKEGAVLFSGQIGQLKEQNGVTLLVSDINALPGTRFTLTKLMPLQAIRMVLNNLSVADKGKDTGVLGLGYTGEHPAMIRRILNQIINNYLLQNVQRKSEEAENSLTFLKEQLPLTRTRLNEAENKLNQFRRQNESVDMSLEAKSALDAVVSIQGQLNELTFREAEVSQLFTKGHPTYRALLEKRKTLEAEQAKLNKKIGQMPQTQQEILRLTRDVQSGQEIYMQLLNRQQELGITKASTVGDVRIIDYALTTEKPVHPKRLLVVLICMIGGIAVSAAGVLIKSLFHHGIERPEQLEEIGINVYACVPLSEWQCQRNAEISQRHRGRHVKEKSHHTLLALGNPNDISIEAIRNLRTSLHFAMMETPNNVLVITGASPNIGKTFICSNLAVLVAQAGKKVLLIDGDMRRGYLHQLLGAENKVGLSDILSGRVVQTPSVVQQGDYEFDFISRGAIPPNPSELLLRPQMSVLLAWASQHYDLVLIDAPPILAVTDASIIGKLAGASLLVARFGINSIKEVEVSYKRFEQNNIDIKGVILNAVVRKAVNACGYGYDYYEYSYTDKVKKE